MERFHSPRWEARESALKSLRATVFRFDSLSGTCRRVSRDLLKQRPRDTGISGAWITRFPLINHSDAAGNVRTSREKERERRSKERTYYSTRCMSSRRNSPVTRRNSQTKLQPTASRCNWTTWLRFGYRIFHSVSTRVCVWSGRSSYLLCLLFRSTKDEARIETIHPRRSCLRCLSPRLKVTRSRWPIVTETFRSRIILRTIARKMARESTGCP